MWLKSELWFSCLRQSEKILVNTFTSLVNSPYIINNSFAKGAPRHPWRPRAPAVVILVDWANITSRKSRECMSKQKTYLYILGFLQLVIFTQFFHQNHQGGLFYIRLCYICTLSMLVQSLPLTRKVAIRRIDGRREIFITISPSVSFADSSLIRWSQRTLNTYRISMYLYLKCSDRLGIFRDQLDKWDEQ